MYLLPSSLEGADVAVKHIVIKMDLGGRFNRLRVNMG